MFLLYIAITYWKPVQGVLSTLIGAAFPLIAGAVIAYFVNILMTFYERHFFTKSKKAFVLKARRPLCMVGAFLTIILLVTLIMQTVVPQLVSCVGVILAELPGALSYLTAQIAKLNILPQDIENFLSDIDWQSRIGEIIEVVTSSLGGIVNVAYKAVTGVFSGIFTALLSIIFSVYLLLSKDKLKGQFGKLMNRYLKENWNAKVFYVVEILNDSFHRFFVGQVTEAFILGALCTLGMLIFRFPYAAMIGALVGFTALVPIVGSFVGAFVGAFMILTVSPVQALGFLIFIVILQQLEGNLIYPKVVGKSIGLPGLWVLAAVTLGGGISGVVGMLVSVPLAATVYRIIRDDVYGISVLTKGE